MAIGSIDWSLAVSESCCHKSTCCKHVAVFFRYRVSYIEYPFWRTDHAGKKGFVVVEFYELLLAAF